MTSPRRRPRRGRADSAPRRLGPRSALPLALVLLAGCGPSPARLCKHMVALTEAEVGADAAASIDADKCRAMMRRERQARGITEYRSQASCILEAEDYSALGRCR